MLNSAVSLLRNFLLRRKLLEKDDEKRAVHLQRRPRIVCRHHAWITTRVALCRRQQVRPHAELRLVHLEVRGVAEQADEIGVSAVCADLCTSSSCCEASNEDAGGLLHLPERWVLVWVSVIRPLM